MNVFSRELRANAKGTALFAAVLAFFMAVGTVKFTGAESAAGADGGAAMNELLSQFPPIVLAVFGIPGGVDLATFDGFYAVLGFYAAVIMAACAVWLGRSAVSRELSDGTYEFLFTKPVSRGRVLAEKLAAAVVSLAAMCAVNFASSLAAYQTLGLSADATELIARYTLWLALLAAFFLGAGAAAAALAARPETGARVGLAVVLASYAMSVAYDMFSDSAVAGALRAFSPIRWFAPEDIAAGAFPFEWTALCLGLAAALLALSFWAFSRRDLAAR